MYNTNSGMMRVLEKDGLTTVVEKDSLNYKNCLAAGWKDKEMFIKPVQDDEFTEASLETEKDLANLNINATIEEKIKDSIVKATIQSKQEGKAIDDGLINNSFVESLKQKIGG